MQRLPPPRALVALTFAFVSWDYPGGLSPESEKTLSMANKSPKFKIIWWLKISVSLLIMTTEIRGNILNFIALVTTEIKGNILNFIALMTTEIKGNILNFIVQKVSRIIIHYQSVYKSSKLIRKMHRQANRVVLTLIIVSGDCDNHCCLKIVTMGLTQWEKNLKLKLLNVCSKKYASML